MTTTHYPKPEAIIFDMDGTLFKTESILLTAYHRLFDDLRREGLYNGETPPEERILGGLGMLLEEIWRRVMPEEPVEVHQRADALLLQHQLRCLEQGEGDLYPGVEETLRQLHSQGVRLYVASNGLEDYVKLVAKHKGIAELFENMYSAGEYQTQSKVDLVRLLLERYGINHAWMVGDRSSDVEAGIKNNLFVVGCNYADFGGEGELDEADVLISDFTKLIELYGQSK